MPCPDRILRCQWANIGDGCNGAMKVVQPLRIYWRETVAISFPDCLIRLATSLLLSTFLLGNCHPDTVSPSWDVVEHPLNRKKTICGACPAILRHTQNIVSAHQASGELLLCRLKRKGTIFSKARSCYRNKLQWLLIPSFQSSCHGCYIMSGSKLPQLFFNILPTTSELWNL